MSESNPLIPVTQSDRDAAADFIREWDIKYDADTYPSWTDSLWVREGRGDSEVLVQAFARNRLASAERWLPMPQDVPDAPRWDVEDRDWIEVRRRDGTREKGQMMDIYFGDRRPDDPQPDDVLEYRYLAKDER